MCTAVILKDMTF